MVEEGRMGAEDKEETKEEVIVEWVNSLRFDLIFQQFDFEVLGEMPLSVAFRQDFEEGVVEVTFERRLGHYGVLLHHSL